jgi:hypothetical protein
VRRSGARQGRQLWEEGGRREKTGSDTKLENEILTLTRVGTCINRPRDVGPSPLHKGMKVITRGLTPKP